MRIAFDARILARPYTGINTYVVNLVRELHRQGRHRLVLLSDRPLLPDSSEVISQVPVVVFGERVRRWWPHHRLSWYLHRHPVDVYHATADDGVPLWAPCPSLLTLHSTPPLLLRGHQHRWKKRVSYRLSHALERRIARRVITVSRFSYEEILHHLPTLKEKLRVVPCGVDELFRPIANGPARQDVLRRHDLHRRPYILAVPSRLLEPRKNVARLLETYARLRPLMERPIELVLLGSAFGNTHALADLLAHCPPRWRADVHLIEYVLREDLPAIFSAAQVLFFPSLFEGFGSPLVEAMASGTPVVASNTGALPEVAGEAAMLVDPTDPEAMARALLTVLSDEAWRHELVKRGLARVQCYSWAQAAEATAALYEEVLRDGTR